MENELLKRGVSKIYPTREALEQQLQAGKKLRIYFGIDPTGNLHIGHAVQLKKLRGFQDLGHEIIILIGDFTARIGDPTDKSSARIQLSKDEVKKHAKNYKELIGKILDTNKANLRFVSNEEWTKKLKPTDLLQLASHFTVSQLLERDMFQERIKAKKEIFLHEFMYPIFQAYDAVILDVDMQIGGTDQTFNMLAGRTLMKKMNNKEKFVLTMEMLTSPSGKKMSKSEGKIIALDASADEMFGAVMSWPDDMIVEGLILLSNLSIAEIRQLEGEMKEGRNPKEIKEILAKEIVEMCHGKEKAEKAAKEFENIFKNNELPVDIKEIKIEGNYPLPNLLVEVGLVSSGSEARRLIEASAVTIDGAKCGDASAQVAAHSGMIIKVGKRRFVKIK